MVQELVVVRMAPDLPSDYLAGIRDGMVLQFSDLELFPQCLARPAVALPTDRTEYRNGYRLPVYEIHALGSL